MVVVPRLFELLRARMLKAIEKEGALPRWLLAKAMAMGERPAPDRSPARPAAHRHYPQEGPQALRRAAEGARFRRRAAQPGGRTVLLRARARPAPRGYGQTEAAPVISCNRPRAGIRLDTVGPPLLNTEVRIAADGEILVRGENVMHGYWRNDAETARVLVDGWLHTGDVGHIDEGGRIVITDRKKDLIVNDKGENIAPQRIEGMLTLEPEIAQAMVAGDRRPHLVGLIVPDAELAAGKSDAEVARLMTAAVDRVNAGLSPLERVRRILIADEPFTIENGEMTPSLKTKRHVLRERYGARLDGLYKS